MKYLITGGLGFIGSAVVRRLFQNTSAKICVLDAYTYAAQPDALETASVSARVEVHSCDIRNLTQLVLHINRFAPDHVMHFAAETHVDRSIDAPDDFITTNLLGTHNLLKACLTYFEALPDAQKQRFRFQHISTDEVFGSLGVGDAAFTEQTPYDPRSPYSASKAGSDHLVSAWFHTYRLPTIITNCSNNYGPWQYPEKLIPLIISKGLNGDPMPVYGTGENIRDWLHVDDHAEALALIASKAAPGSTYTVGGNSERSNLQVVELICELLDDHVPEKAPHKRLIQFVDDRPGHDFRYAIDIGKLAQDIGWSPKRTFEDGLRETVAWYLERPHLLRNQSATARIGLKRGETLSSS